MLSSIPNLWGIVLAGGDGTRLAPLTRHITGHDCPKQFCALAGRRSLLAETLARIRPLISPARTVVVGHRAHAAYLGRELSGPVPRRLVQPLSRGTGPAILWPTRWVGARDPAAIVAVFPSDHFVRGERAFLAHVARAGQVVTRRPDLVLLLGIRPDGPEEGYGWIQPGEPLPAAPDCWRVRGFWEKPALERAREFLRAGFLWNSLIVVARAGTLEALGRRYLPDIDARLARITGVTPHAARAVDEVYADMPAANFSRDVLEQGDPSLAVLPVGGVLWSDWGTPERVLQTLARLGTRPPWLETWLARSA